MKKINLNLSQNPYEIWIGSGILKRLPQMFPTEVQGRAFLIADQKLKTQTDQVKVALENAGWVVHVLRLHVSEGLKDFRRIYPLYGYLLRNGADRHSVIFALGGGVIGDAVGFIAGTYLRGIRWVGIPTTLLAQVDSAVGGKTGINHKSGKNLIGVFHQPAGVICDLSLLKTLSMRDRVSGMGEIIKYGLTFDTGFFGILKSNWKKILKLESSILSDAVYQSLRLKAQMVIEDERDYKGIREILNFGHTLGHALESVTGYGYFRHGEAVILGMRGAAYLSVLRGHLTGGAHAEIDEFLRSLPVPKIPKKVKSKELLSKLKFDKKVRNNRVRFVLLRAVGQATLDIGVLDKEVLLTIDWLRQNHS